MPFRAGPELASSALLLGMRGADAGVSLARTRYTLVDASEHESPDPGGPSAGRRWPSGPTRRKPVAAVQPISALPRTALG